MRSLLYLSDDNHLHSALSSRALIATEVSCYVGLWDSRWWLSVWDYGDLQLLKLFYALIHENSTKAVW